MYLCVIRPTCTMIARRHIALLFTTLCSITTARAQIIFDPATWNFGSIAEANGAVSHVFTGVNKGSVPVVILDVVASCGCTRPEFSRRPVMPGDTTRIKVTYDPANRPGSFDKELGIYSSERRKIATLSIRGSVTPREKSIEELYPVEAGGGLRLNETLCAFTYIYPGQRVQAAIGYANTSTHTVHLELRATHASGLVDIDYPREIGPGERGEINVSYLIPADKPRYGTLRDALDVIVDDHPGNATIVAHAIGVDAPAEGPAGQAPQAQTSTRIVKFGSVKRSAPLQRLSFVLSNTGGRDLIVRAVENGGHVAVTLAPGRKIAPGANCRVELLLDPSAQEYGPLTDHLLLVTNDPERPMQRIRVTAIIED